MQFSHNKIIAIHSALAILGNRKMATINGDLRVARLLRLFTPEAELIKKAKNRIIVENTSGDVGKLEQIERYKLQAILNDKANEFDSEMVDILLPENLRIKEEDLPKELSGDDGWKNANQLGAIVADLDCLFEFTGGV